MTDAPQFDRFAKGYDQALAQGLSFTGETKEYFARERIRWLARCLMELSAPAFRILDFGCGTGSSVPWLVREFHPDQIIGVDVSRESLREAEERFGAPNVQFRNISAVPKFSCDLAFCNGVFHHIPPAERAAALQSVWNCLRPGGLFALWENNPWNPGTRYVMSRIPFDRDAITLTAFSARRLVRASGFRVLRTDHLFLFPGPLKGLRFVEPALSQLPIGGQYQVLAQKHQRPNGQRS